MWEDTLIVYTTDNGGDIYICEDGRKDAPKDKRFVKMARILFNTMFGREESMEKDSHQNLPWSDSESSLEQRLIRFSWRKTGYRPLPLLPEWLHPAKSHSMESTNSTPFVGAKLHGTKSFLGYSVEGLDTVNGKDVNGSIGAYAAIRNDKWKLLRTKNRESYLLYDLKKDPRETTDVKRQYPKVARPLKNLIFTRQTFQTLQDQKPKTQVLQTMQRVAELFGVVVSFTVFA
jgi:arylsulfatase A-like enzyme